MFRKAIIAVVVSGLSFVLTAVLADSANAARPRCTVERGQAFIDAGRYDDAVREFTCVINADPTGVEGYRGRIEAFLLLGRFASAVGDYARGVTALVEQVHPDARSTILAGYADRLAVAPDSIPALTGLSFAHWWYFEYNHAIQVLNTLLALRPNDLYGNLFRGSSRVLQGSQRAAGVVDLDRAIALAPQNPDVHYVVSDAYTYGMPDPQRALSEATIALDGGLDTPRVHAILATAYSALGEPLIAATHIQRHIELVTTEFVATSPILSATSLSLPLVPGRTFDIPLPAVAGQPVSIATSSRTIWDTILLLLAPDGSLVLGSDDFAKYLAGFVGWVPAQTGTYRLQVTSFESVNTGELVVKRD
jgi:tetratricopeptide (TPR) repeat protein